MLRELAVGLAAGWAFGSIVYELPRGTALDSAWVAFEVAWPVESVLAKYTLHAHAPLVAPAEG